MRIMWVDIAKGIGIILVTIGHTNMRHILGGYVGHWINCFHMPLFFVMAGLCFNPTRYSTFVSYLSRKLLALGWPFVALSVFMAVLSIPLYWGNDQSMSFISQIKLLLTLNTKVNTFWFIKTLFEVEILYWIVAKLCKNGYLQLAIALTAGFIGVFIVPQGWKPLQWNTMITSLGYYGAGVFLRQYVNDFGKFKIKARNMLFTGVAVLACYSVVVYKLHPSEFVGFWGVIVGNPSVFVFLSILGIAGVAIVSMAIEHVPLACTVFAWLGANSIILMALHGHCGLFAASWVSSGRLSVVGSKIVMWILFSVLTWLLANPLKLLVRFPLKKK